MSELSTTERDTRYSPDSDQQPSAPQKASAWEDFVDIFYAPSAVFARRENASVWTPLLAVTILMGIVWLAGSGALQPVFEGDFQRQIAVAMKKNPQLTADAAEKMRGFSLMMMKVGMFLFTPIAIACVGVVLWACGKLVDAKQSLHAALVVAAFAYVPRVLDSVVRVLQGLLMDSSSFKGLASTSLSAARFLDLDTASPLMVALLSRVDVFVIWSTVLLAIGLAVTGKISRGKAAVAATLVWIVATLAAVLPALRQG